MMIKGWGGSLNFSLTERGYHSVLAVIAREGHLFFRYGNMKVWEGVHF